MRTLANLFCLTTFCLTALVGGCAPALDANSPALAATAAKCEAPTADLLVEEAPMLPGRDCIGCHSSGGIARDVAWTAAGTVFDSIGSPCNSGGLADVQVQIADATTRQILITLTTNRTGNFFTSESRKFQNIIARITKGTMTKEMSTPAPSGDCPSCHYPGGPAGGRIYLN
jgi:hypothetical protein